MTGQQDKDDEADIRNADDQQVKPVSQSAVFPIEDDCDRDAGQRNEQQIPCALIDFPLYQARFKASSKLEALNRGYNVQQSPDDIKN